MDDIESHYMLSLDTVCRLLLQIKENRCRQAYIEVSVWKQSSSVLTEERLEKKAGSTELVTIKQSLQDYLCFISFISSWYRVSYMSLMENIRSHSWKAQNKCLTSCTKTVRVDSPCHPRLLLALTRKRAPLSTTVLKSQTFIRNP